MLRQIHQKRSETIKMNEKRKKSKANKKSHTKIKTCYRFFFSSLSARHSMWWRNWISCVMPTLFFLLKLIGQVSCSVFPGIFFPSLCVWYFEMKILTQAHANNNTHTLSLFAQTREGKNEQHSKDKRDIPNYLYCCVGQKLLRVKTTR